MFVLQTIIYTPLIYWLTGMTSTNNGAHYFLYILVIFLCAISFAMITRLLASLCKTKEAASALAGSRFYFCCSFCYFGFLWWLRLRIYTSPCSTFSYFPGLCIIFFLLFSGFLIVKSKVPDWWIWVYYISPLQWAITAIVCNEFLSDRYSEVSGFSNQKHREIVSHITVLSSESALSCS